MFRNNNHDKTSIISKGKLKFYGLDLAEKFSVEIKGESSKSILLSELLKEANTLIKGRKAQIFTWFLSLDQPTSEIFWISYWEIDGCILGDHSF